MNFFAFAPSASDATFSFDKGIEFEGFSIKDNIDFLYADPPYLISCGSYNDGKRGFEGWSPNDDLALFEKLDSLNQRGISFALSNVTRHKGEANEPLIEWANNYNVHYLNADYSNSNYQATESETVEVLITNY